jgi:hypothetical protein
MTQNLLKRIFTLDIRKDFYPSLQNPNFSQFVVDNLDDSIYALIDHWIEIFSISEFPYERERGRNIGIDAVYINQIDIEEALGFLAICGNNCSGNPPFKMYDIRNHKFKWIISSFSKRFIENSRAVGRRIDERFKCKIINLPVSSAFNVRISPTQDYLITDFLDETEDMQSRSLKKFSLQGELLAECKIPNITDFSIHPKGEVIAAISGKSIIFINPASLEVFTSQKITSATAQSIIFDSEGKQLLVTSQQGEIISIDLDLGTLWSMKVDAIPRCVKYDMYSRCFYVGTNLADILMLDTDGTLVDSNRVSESVRDICFLHQGRHVLVGCKNMDFHIFVNAYQEAKASYQEWESRLGSFDTSLYTSTHQLQNLRLFDPSTSITDKYKVELVSSREQIEIYRQHNTDLLGVIKAVVDKPIKVQNLTTSEIKIMAEKSEVNQNFSGPVGSVAGSNLGTINTVQHNYAPEQKQSLAEAAEDIQKLLLQLSQTYPTTTPTEKAVIATKAVEQIESNPTLKARIIKGLKAGGTEAIKELVDHPAINILLATLEGFQDS